MASKQPCGAGHFTESYSSQSCRQPRMLQEARVPPCMRCMGCLGSYKFISTLLFCRQRLPNCSFDC